MTDIDYDAIEARAVVATEGPWVAEYSGEQGNCVIPHDAQSTREAVCVTRLYDQMADAEFIAHARTDIPALLAALRERDATIARVRYAIDNSAIYRPDHAAYGDDAWDNIETVDLARLLNALDPQEGEADTKFLHTSPEHVNSGAETSHVAEERQ